MIDQQPALVGLNGNGAGADFGGLPGGLVSLHGTHYMAVAAPEFHVRALADEHVSERGVAGVAGPGEHHIQPVDFPGEQYAVAVIGQEGVFKLVEGPEILRPAHADGGAVIPVAPGYVILPVHKAHPGVVPVLPDRHIRITLKMDRLVLNLPMDAVLAEAGEDIHTHGPAVTAEHTCESVLKRHDRTVKNTVGIFCCVASDDGVAGIAPYGHMAVRRLRLPGEVFQLVSNNLAHKRDSLS